MTTPQLALLTTVRLAAYLGLAVTGEGDNAISSETASRQRLARLR